MFEYIVKLVGITEPTSIHADLMYTDEGDLWFSIINREREGSDIVVAFAKGTWESATRGEDVTVAE